MSCSGEPHRVQPGGLLNQFLSFAAAGAVGTALHYLILVALVSSGTAQPVSASAAAFAAGAAVNYLLNYQFTFSSRKRHTETAGKYSIVALSGLLLNSVIMMVGVAALAWHYLLTQVIATGIVLLWNFTAHRTWTFRERRDDSNRR